MTGSWRDGRGLDSLKRTLQARLKHADPSTEPFLRAFLLGYAASTLPSLIKSVIALAIGKKRNVSKTLRQLATTFVHALNPRGLAFASGVAVGGAKWLEPRLEPFVRAKYTQRIEQHRSKGKGKEKVDNDDHTATDEKRVAMLTTFASATLSALTAIVILQSAPGYQRPPMRPAAAVVATPVILSGPSPYAELLPAPRPIVEKIVHIPVEIKKKVLVPQSPTLDLTLFLLVRATDSLVRGAYESSNLSKAPKGSLTHFIAENGDTLVFWISCYRIMWCWFYLPHLLPPSYVKWITSLSRMDTRLLRLLQFARDGKFAYGKVPEPAVARVCAGIAEKLGRPATDVLPNHTTALDCQFVHGFTGPGSCERNAIHRWLRAFVDCLYIYLPVHFVPQILFNFSRLRGAPIQTVAKTLLAASRSSAFLATFVASIYASVCLMRTRVPQVLPSLFSQQRLDGGLCTGLGCLMCGLSVLIENKRRRREMALYCAPRALYAILDDIMPSRMTYGRRGLFLSTWAERVIFALSTGVTLSATVHRPDLVSGVMHGIASTAVGSWGGEATKIQGRKRKHSLSSSKNGAASSSGAKND